jgi:hypothetical protein
VIIACHDELWLLEVGLPRSLAHPRVRVVAGDIENTARHFINKYGQDCESQPLDRLVTLAAYTVLVAGEENPHGVRGLEIAVIPKGGAPIFLTSEEEQELKRLSDGLDAAIRERLLQPFKYQ